ncbi:hypothetical protein HanRHA438_Chr15g0689231 [Helianthus annuus]|nr:hypothetical protein HanRHA438_Chr15g0689231 [Helianthus annuus]
MIGKACEFIRNNTCSDRLFDLALQSIATSGKSNEWYTLPNLLYMYCPLTHMPCTLAMCLAQYFVTYYHGQ